MALNTMGIVSIIVTLLPIFLGSNPTEQEIAAFLVAIAPFLGPNAPTSGEIPAFRVGQHVFGPIPFGPASA